MKGYDVLHPMGWDSFGLPAEQFAINTGTQPAATTTANIANFKRQLKSLGFSYDWDRELATTDVDYVRWTQWIFLQLYKKGLAQQSVVSVNWCPGLGTVLANEEVIDGLSERGDFPVERLPLRQWVLRITDYADRLEQGLEGLDWPSGTMTAQERWIGRSVGCNIDFGTDAGDTISVFTTRADTLMGVTYVTLAPEHPLVSTVTTDDRKEEVDRYVKETSSRSDLDRTAAKEKTGAFTGGYALHPLTGKKVPIWVGDYVLGSYGTGGRHGRARPRPTGLRVRHQVQTGRHSRGPTQRRYRRLQHGGRSLRRRGNHHQQRRIRRTHHQQGQESRHLQTRPAPERRTQSHLQTTRLGLLPPALLGRAHPHILPRRFPHRCRPYHRRSPTRRLRPHHPLLRTDTGRRRRSTPRAALPRRFQTGHRPGRMPRAREGLEVLHGGRGVVREGDEHDAAVGRELLVLFPVHG